jgi:site-specific recombinase XerD
MSSNIGREPAIYIAEKIKAGGISAADGKQVLKFIADRSTTSNTAAHTEASYARYLVKGIELMGKPIKQWDYQRFADFAKLVKLEYATNTYRKHIGMMKSFILFLIETGVVTTVTREQMLRVKTPKSNLMTKVAGDMLSPDEALAIVAGARNSRDRALIATLFESGCRPIELLELEWDDVNFDQHGATINTNKKTGKPRRIRIINMAEHLKSWKNDYPAEPKGTNPVFVNLDTSNHHALSRGGLKKLLQKAVANSGVTKRVHPYLFRHSRVTEMLAEGIPESVISLQHWGSISSPMLRTYGHLSGHQVDDILLAHAGKSTREPIAQSAIKPVDCPACGNENPSGTQYCNICGSILDPVKYRELLDAPNEVESLKAEVSKLRVLFKEMSELFMARQTMNRK